MIVELIWSLISDKDFVPKFLSYIIVSAHIYSGFALSPYPPPPNESFCFSCKTYSNQRISLTDPPQVKRRSKNSFQFLNIKSEQTLFCSMYFSNVCVVMNPPFYHTSFAFVLQRHRAKPIPLVGRCLGAAVA